MTYCDSEFGPRVDPSCRSFDFTLYFQDILFAVAPNAVLLVLVSLPIVRLSRAQDVVKRTKLAAAKAVGGDSYPAFPDD